MFDLSSKLRERAAASAAAPCAWDVPLMRLTREKSEVTTSLTAGEAVPRQAG